MTGGKLSALFHLSFLVALWALPCPAANPVNPVTALFENCVHGISERNLTIARLREHRGPILVAHGKNDNIAMESTWMNMVHSLENGANVLEVDLQMTSDGHFMILHDPTFHRLILGYITAADKIESFKAEHPDLWAAMHHDWRIGLVDRISTYAVKEIKTSRILSDLMNRRGVEAISLDELLGAIAHEGSYVVPEHREWRDWTEHTVPERTLDLNRSVNYYFDMKDLNLLARRLSGLKNDYDWLNERLTTPELIEHTRTAIRNLSRTLTAHGAHDRVFIAVRHPKVAELVHEIDPKIHFMASPEYAPGISEDALAEMILEFAKSKPAIIEIKQLRYLKSRKVREAIKQIGAKLFYNEIIQTDPSQFTGRYRDNLTRLLSEIFEAEPDLMIQTNTVRPVREFLQRERGLPDVLSPR